MTRVIHTGDTHLGYRQYHREERRQDFHRAFRQVADDAVDEAVDAVVHAGDLFHDRRPDLTDIMGVLDVLETLSAADIPFLAVVGNHEAKRSGQWLDLFESLGLATRLGPDPLRVGTTAFYGLDFVPRSKREAFQPDFNPHDTEHAALVTHGLFEPFEFGEWDPREILEPASVTFEALLLGDNHEPATAQVDGTWVTYCGSTERASAAEREDRGYNLVSFDDSVDVRRRGLDTREFVYIDVDLGEGEGLERVRERVGQYTLEDAVAVVTIDGEGDPVTPASVEAFALDQEALVARVTDRRETSDESEREVSFADPDHAVRERVRELGLSSAARDVDEVVRASKVADSNVADEVEAHVAALVEDGDLAAFEGGETENTTAQAAADRARSSHESAETGTGDEREAEGNGVEATAENADRTDEGTGEGTDTEATLEDFA
jgi:exonuclease SbcD